MPVKKRRATKSSAYRDFAHIGPETLAGKFLRRFWQPVYVAKDLAPGIPVRIKRFGEHFTLYRGESGAFHIVGDRCPHRLTQMSLGWVEGERIRCFYHGWVFDGSGQCLEQPAEKASFARKMRIDAYPTQEYLGLVFAYFGEGEPPALPRFPELEIDRGILVATAHGVPCNYFQRIENDLDETHLHFVHKVSCDVVDSLNKVPQIKVRESEYGIYREGHRPTENGTDVRYGHYLMPNTLLVDLPPSPENEDWAIHLAWRVPVDDENMITSTAARRGAPRPGAPKPADSVPKWKSADVYVEEILAGRMRIQDIDQNYPRIFVVQDNVALAGQGRMVEREKERLGQSDAGIILLRKLWERELKALAGGKSMKKWRRSSDRLALFMGGTKELV
jgi:5,5'-dehydrodivanillate O-demethylase oxygenase subunit